MNNFYIRLNRDNIKGKNISKLYVIMTIYVNLIRIIHPLCPYICEYIYNNMKNMIEKNNKLNNNYTESICDFRFSYNNFYSDLPTENFDKVKEIIEIIREYKIKNNIKTTQIIDTLFMPYQSDYKEYIKKECNIKNILYRLTIKVIINENKRLKIIS